MLNKEEIEKEKAMIVNLLMFEFSFCKG